MTPAMTSKSPLGKAADYSQRYAPELLFPIARVNNRAIVGLDAVLPFHGTDIWNAWDLSWLDLQGLPQVATVEIRVPADSPNMVESKSLKLYLNSFSMTAYVTDSDVAETIEQDLSACAGRDVEVRLKPVSGGASVTRLPGDCLDVLHVRCDAYDVDSELLQADRNDIAREDLYSNLLRSLCPVTNQPDIGSILIS